MTTFNKQLQCLSIYSSLPPQPVKPRPASILVKSAGQNDPFSEIWFVVPDQIQADAVRTRFSATGQALTVRVATFRDLYEEIWNDWGAACPWLGTACSTACCKRPSGPCALPENSPLRSDLRFAGFPQRNPRPDCRIEEIFGRAAAPGRRGPISGRSWA